MAVGAVRRRDHPPIETPTRCAGPGAAGRPLPRPGASPASLTLGVRRAAPVPHGPRTKCGMHRCTDYPFSALFAMLFFAFRKIMPFFLYARAEGKRRQCHARSPSLSLPFGLTKAVFLRLHVLQLALIASDIQVILAHGAITATSSSLLS